MKHYVDAYGDLPPVELFEEECQIGEDGACEVCGERSDAPATALDADHLHVILDALQFAHAANIPEHFSAGYADPSPEDPKGTPEGWERTRADAERIVGDMLGSW